jgi:hypothetical protein
VVEKKSPTVCGGRASKAKSESMHAPYSALAFKSQTLNFQAAHVARRFDLAPHVAALVASLAFGEARQ